MKLRAAFLTGVAIILPLVVTIFVLKVLIVYFSNLLQPIVNFFISYLPKFPFIVFLAKSLIFIFLLALIALIGFAARTLLIKRVLGLGEKIFSKLPLASKVYIATKEISNAFFGEKRGIFKRVVLIEFPRKGLYSIGFVTSEAQGEMKKHSGEDSLNVFIPTTPNPTSGFFICVPRNEIKELGISVEQGMKMVVSGGAVTLK